jgi:hypothetical protein
MKKALLFCSLLCLSAAAQAQLKLGDNPSTIDPSSILELESSSKALYLTRVNLSSTSDMATVPNPKAGMLVYNTNAAISGMNATGAGLYYFDGANWVSMNAVSAIDSAGLNWRLLGNAGTADNVNFLGTKDAVPLTIRVNNLRSGRIEMSGTGNTSLGYQTMPLNTPNTGTGAGLFNTAVGGMGMNANTSGRSNAALGYSAGMANTTGDSNVFVGSTAGNLNSTGSNNTYLGANANGLGINLRWTGALGAQSMVTVANGLSLGATDAGAGAKNSLPTTMPMSSYFVGINVMDPTQRIDFRNGHIRNRQDAAPTIGTVGPAGNGVTAAAVSVGSSDVRGVITTTGYNNSNGLTQVRINFQYACTNPPVVTITPANQSAATTTYYVTSDAQGFDLWFRNIYTGGNSNGPAAVFNYHVLE